MRKQVDFAVRVLDYSQTDPNRSSIKWSEYIRDNYLSQGWEVLGTEVSSVEPNVIFIAVTLVKYEDEPVVAAKK